MTISTAGPAAGQTAGMGSPTPADDGTADSSPSNDNAAALRREFDALVFIGRFQPFHLGHKAVVEAALARARRAIVLVGSARQPRSIRNPWTFEERAEMILGAWPEAERARILVAPLPDRLYNDQAWIAGVQRTVAGLLRRHPGEAAPAASAAGPARIGLIGRREDGTGYYPRMFPHWPPVPVEAAGALSGTQLRERYFAGPEEGRAWLNTEAGAVLPETVVRFLAGFLAAPDGAYARIEAEIGYVRDYRRSWAAAPFPPVFVTVDAVVVQSGHVLMIERKGMPGRGLLALPGGFVDQAEPLRAAMLRELAEETRIAVPVPVLEDAIRAQRVFDAPYRSARGRTITHAFLVVLGDSAEGLPAVEGDDDAASARWVPLGDLDPVAVFEDHWHIVQAMLGLL